MLKTLILRELEIVDFDRFQYTLDEIFDELKAISEKTNELEKNFKTHRHCIDKPYSEKPAW